MISVRVEAESGQNHAPLSVGCCASNVRTGPFMACRLRHKKMALIVVWRDGLARSLSAGRRGALQP
jgi:hypothetical protein